MTDNKTPESLATKPREKAEPQSPPLIGLAHTPEGTPEHSKNQSINNNMTEIPGIGHIDPRAGIATAIAGLAAAWMGTKLLGNMKDTAWGNVLKKGVLIPVAAVAVLVTAAAVLCPDSIGKIPRALGRKMGLFGEDETPAGESTHTTGTPGPAPEVPDTKPIDEQLRREAGKLSGGDIVPAADPGNTGPTRPSPVPINKDPSAPELPERN